VTFTVVKPTIASVIAKQSGGSFDPYKAKAGDEIYMLKTGSHSAAEMFKAAQDSNSTLTWVLRFVGFLLMTIGFYLVFRPLETLADVVPFIGSLLGAGLFFFALLISAMISAVVIAVAWIFYRPILAMGLIGGGIACAVILVVVARNRRTKR
jgi:hypothetical protein